MKTKIKKFLHIFFKPGNPVIDEIRQVYKGIRYPPETNQNKRWEAAARKQAEPYRGELDNE